MRRSTCFVGLVSVTIAAALLVLPSAGWADTAVLPQDLRLPWTDPAHQGPLEQLLAPIASKLVGRPVAVRCEGDFDWNTLATQGKFDPATELGYVRAGSYYVATNEYVSSATMMELSPSVCSHLQRFAQAAVKPTKCQATETKTVNVTRQRLVTRYRVVKLTKPTRVNGRLLKPGVRRVPYQVKVPYTTTETQDVLAPPAPCFTGELHTETTTPGVCWQVPDRSGTREKTCYRVTAEKPVDTYWRDFGDYARAMITVAHEAVHLQQVKAGAVRPADAIVESQAMCSGMQWLADIAVALGDTPDDAQAIATYFWSIEYPWSTTLDSEYSKAHPYWSADCKPGGALDIRADKSGFWP